MSIQSELDAVAGRWELPRLEDIIAFAAAGDWGDDPQSTNPDLVDVLCIRASDLRDWKESRGSTAALRKLKSARLQTRMLQAGDILIEISGGGPTQPVGRTVVIGQGTLNYRPDLPKICSNFMRVVRLRPCALPHFVYYYLQFFYRSGEIVKYQGGSNNLRNLKFGDFIGIRVPLPPTAEQHRIVAKIEELFSELDKGIENLKRARAQLGVYRQALLKHAFEGKLTAEWRARGEAGSAITAATYIESLKHQKSHAPEFISNHQHELESWTFATLDELTAYITSGSRGWAEFYAESGSVFIRAQNLNRDFLDLSEVAHVDLPHSAEGKRTQTRIGDVFITITGANVTKAGYLNQDIGEAYVSQHVALCRPLDVALSEYLHLYIISSGGGRKDLEQAAYGAGKPGLNLDNIRSLEIPIPSPDEIPILMQHIRSSIAAIGNVEADIDANLQRAEVLRQAILRRAFAGELVAQDSADEPAGELLARIRQERSAAVNMRPARKAPKKGTRQ